MRQRLHREEYMKECILPHLNYKIIEGDYEVVPGVQVLYTPGHSPGHQSLFIETEQSGSVLLTIDASYTKRILKMKCRSQDLIQN